MATADVEVDPTGPGPGRGPDAREQAYLRQIRRLLTSREPRAITEYRAMIDDVVATADPEELFHLEDRLDGAYLIEALHRAESARADGGDEVATWHLPALAYSRWRIWRSVRALVVSDESPEPASDSTTPAGADLDHIDLDHIELRVEQARCDVVAHLDDGWQPERVIDLTELTDLGEGDPGHV